MVTVAVGELVVRYDSTTAVDGVSFTLDPGRVLSVVGPSGCGKSSLLRAIAGLEAPASGTIELDGVDIVDVPTHRRGLGLVFQDHALFPHRDVAANVAFGLEMAGWSERDRRRRTEEMLELVGLAGFGRRSVAQLSGGEAQRVALARALAPTPRLLLLDEPLASLDRVLREELTAELARLIAELGPTVIHVTHDQTEAFTIADEVAVMRHGDIVHQAKPADLWVDPRTVFVARFLGHRNVWFGPDGPHLVPVDAVVGAPDGPRRMVVQSVDFADGSHRVTGLDGDRTVELRLPVSVPRPSPGDVVGYGVDSTRRVPLIDDDGL